MTPELQKQAEFVQKLLLKAKTLDPKRSPKLPDDDEPLLELAALWAQELHLPRFDPELWEQALSAWLHDPQADSLSVTTWEQKAYQVRDRWERDPELRRRLEDRRKLTRRHREAKHAQRALERRKHATQAITPGRQENQRETPIRAKLPALKANPTALLAELAPKDTECDDKPTP